MFKKFQIYKFEIHGTHILKLYLVSLWHAKLGCGCWRWVFMLNNQHTEIKNFCPTLKRSLIMVNVENSFFLSNHLLRRQQFCSNKLLHQINIIIFLSLPCDQSNIANQLIEKCFYIWNWKIPLTLTFNCNQVFAEEKNFESIKNIW